MLQSFFTFSYPRTTLKNSCDAHHVFHLLLVDYNLQVCIQKPYWLVIFWQFHICYPFQNYKVGLTWECIEIVSNFEICNISNFEIYINSHVLKYILFFLYFTFICASDFIIKHLTHQMTFMQKEIHSSVNVQVDKCRHRIHY